MSDKIHSINFTGADFTLSADDIAPEFLQDLLDCGAPGDAQPAVDYVIETYPIAGDVDNCRKYLEQYGAWDEEQLGNHAGNLERLVWLVGCDLLAQGEAYFSTY